MTENQKKGLVWLLLKIGSWTNATWQQQLRNEFGDNFTDEVIEFVFNDLDFQYISEYELKKNK